MLNKLKKQSGFTIIEVMIVLAIAGLILVVVLVAVPQLQRNQRNEARRSIVARVVTEVNTFSGNNNGRIPTSAADLGRIQDQISGINIEDPSTGVNMTLEEGTAAAGFIELDDAEGEDLAVLYYQDGVQCNGEQLEDGSARSFALYTVLEGGSVVCLGG